tara:strand:+ start:770 stop:880 length:111 start_codon:yes stop_codon:yes gene_type:complete
MKKSEKAFSDGVQDSASQVPTKNFKQVLEWLNGNEN